MVNTSTGANLNPYLRLNSRLSSKLNSKWMMISGLVVGVLTIAPGCSFKKNSGESQAKTPDVIVVEAPPATASGTVVLPEDIVTSIEPLEFGKYQVIARFGQNLEAFVQARYTAHGFGLSKRDEYSKPVRFSESENLAFTCFSGEQVGINFDIFQGQSTPVHTVFKSVTCPTDLSVMTALTGDQVYGLSSVNGRLYFGDNVVIDTLKAARIIVRARAVSFGKGVIFRVQRSRNRPLADGLQFQSSLSAALIKGGAKVCPRTQGYPIRDYFDKSRFLVENVPMTACFGEQEELAVTGQEFIAKNDLIEPGVIIESEEVSGDLRVELIGEDGADGKNGDEVAARSGFYKNVLAWNTPAAGKDGENGKTTRVSMAPSGTGGGSALICMKPNGDGGRGAPGIVPGLDGQRGDDGMPTASMKIRARNTEHLRLELIMHPGRGGNGGRPGRGQLGGLGGAPGKEVAAGSKCAEARSGPRGDTAPSGLSGAKGHGGYCGVVDLGESLAKRTTITARNELADECLAARDTWVR